MTFFRSLTLGNSARLGQGVVRSTPQSLFLDTFIDCW